MPLGTLVPCLAPSEEQAISDTNALRAIADHSACACSRFVTKFALSSR
jgi:hypothetical protein